MDTRWQPDLTEFGGPKYLALAHVLRNDIRSGELAQGTRLPPVRDLAWKLGVTPGTVSRAYQMVTQEGLLDAAVGRGTFVASARPRFGANLPLISEPKHFARRPSSGEISMIDLRSPQLPEVGQTAAVRAVLAEMAGREDLDLLGYQGLRRDSVVRDALVRWLDERDLGAITGDDIVLTQGGQAAIMLALQCCLKGSRPHVMCEELAYPGFRHAARLNRADVVPVALDGEGLSAEALDAACRHSGARIVLVTTEAQNPTTVRMPLERRLEIVKVARRHDLQIIEDDCYSVGKGNLPSLRSLAPERSWHVTSISKSFAAGLRFGCIVCPTDLGEAGRLAAQNSYFGMPRPIIDIVEALLLSGEADRLRAEIQAVFDSRLELMLNALGSFDLSWQRGLAFVWLRLPQGWRASTFAREAEANGVVIRSADEYALVDGRAPNAVRMALVGDVPEPDFVAALNRLARLLRNPPGDLPV
ncbi:MAG TPA: PLP-dependent aminotransferase family protein [Albidovulum sp.]|uniref:aminotransferase-like domain-containing protein n=1 Tax=Albidovulum sp. TaxID=1872424 RepID=UPI002CA29511|nr:PLP-dependent aminotransferase family protein [Albidovulum sp.]